MFGNPAQQANLLPRMKGMLAYIMANKHTT